VALQLKRQGITRVHPLEGGLLRWMALGFPLEDRRPSDSAAFSAVLSSPPQLHQADGDQILPLKLVDAGVSSTVHVDGAPSHKESKESIELTSSKPRE